MAEARRGEPRTGSKRIPTDAGVPLRGHHLSDSSTTSPTARRSKLWMWGAMIAIMPAKIRSSVYTSQSQVLSIGGTDGTAHTPLLNQRSYGSGQAVSRRQSCSDTYGY